MVTTMPFSSPNFFALQVNRNKFGFGSCNYFWRRKPSLLTCVASKADAKIITFLGKGGVGKTNAAVLLSKYFSAAGKKTCLVIQSVEDTVADELLNVKLSSIPSILDDGLLTVIRLETTKTLSAAMDIAKKMDSRVGFSQGMLEEISGDELSVLPGFDSLLAVAVMERLAKPAGGLLASVVNTESLQEDFDVVIFDGISSSETLRMFGSPEKLRWYLKRFRSIAEKTDIGRVALPSAARIVDSFVPSDKNADRSTSEIWQSLDDVLSRTINAFSDPKRFSALLVTDPGNKSANRSCLRLWGMAMQSGISVSGVLTAPSAESFTQQEKFLPLKSISLPEIPENVSESDWPNLLSKLKESSKGVLEGSLANSIPKPFEIDPNAGTVTLFLPGFDKSEVKLSQWKGRSELLIEVGDQRRSIAIPQAMRGKVIGAKFANSTLTVTLKKA